MKSVLKKVETVKTDVEKMVNSRSLKDAQKKVSDLVNSAQKDLSKMVDKKIKANSKDIEGFKKRFDKEKKQVEKFIDDVLIQETQKVTAFVNSQKNELHKFQTRIEDALKDHSLTMPTSSSVKKVFKAFTQKTATLKTAAKKSTATKENKVSKKTKTETAKKAAPSAPPVKKKASAQAKEIKNSLKNASSTTKKSTKKTSTKRTSTKKRANA